MVAESGVLVDGDLARLGLKARFGNDAEKGVGVAGDVGAEHHAIDDGEDAGIDSDADGEGEDDDEREERVAADEAAAIADVFEEGLEEGGGVAAVFVELFLPGFGEEAAGGDHAAGEHVGGALLGGGDVRVFSRRRPRAKTRDRGLDVESGFCHSRRRMMRRARRGRWAGKKAKCGGVGGCGREGAGTMAGRSSPGRNGA